MSATEKRKDKKISRPKPSGDTSQTIESYVQSHGLLSKPPNVQTFDSAKIFFRNLINEDLQQKIYHFNELIEATSKIIRTKEDLNKKCLQEFHHVNNRIKQYSVATAKKVKEFNKMLQTYEANRNLMNQSNDKFMELLVSEGAKELELAELRDQVFASNEKVKQLKGELQEVRDNLNRTTELDESTRKALVKDKERYENTLKQNTEIEENLEKLNADSQAILDRHTEITNELNIAKENVLAGNTKNEQNRAEIAKLLTTVEETRNAVAANHKTIENLNQQIGIANVSLVDSRVEVRIKICAMERHNSETKIKMEKAQQSFNALRDEIVGKIRLETERQQLASERKRKSIEMKTNTMKRKLTPTRPPQGNDSVIDLANSSISPSSSSHSLEVSFLVSKRARVTSNNDAILQATFDSTSESDNFLL